jgi:hypothetical protein
MFNVNRIEERANLASNCRNGGKTGKAGSNVTGVQSARAIVPVWSADEALKAVCSRAICSMVHSLRLSFYRVEIELRREEGSSLGIRYPF